jgi:diadenosine tetraphosphate (Ap4A) HIT family hydrolase
MDYDLLKIKSYKYWDVYLHENQGLLGRIFVQLRNDEGVEDFLAIDDAARDEFFFVGREINRALKRLFRPDKMNYAALSNNSPRIHVHFVPRYKDAREFNEVMFKDTRWGKNYAPYEPFPLEEAVLFNIKDAIKEML